jgi:hypothetical protein
MLRQGNASIATRASIRKARKGDRGLEGDDPGDAAAYEQDGKGAEAESLEHRKMRANRR